MKTIFRILSKLNGKILLICSWFSIFLMFSLSTLVIIAVFYRYVLNDSLSWSEELARYLMVWLVFACGPLVLAEGLFTKLTLFTDMLPEAYRSILGNAAHICNILVFAVLFYHGTALATHAMSQRFSSLDISFFWAYAAIPFGSALMILISLGQLGARIQQTSSQS